VTALRLGLLVGAAFSFTAGQARPVGVLVALALVAALAVHLQWPGRWSALVGLTVVALAGLVLRIDAYGSGFSDVLTVTVAAIERVLADGNPYGVGYPETVPPGAPYPYGPLALLWYLPFRDDPRRFEWAVSVATLAILALRGRALGLALYATFPPLLSLASDGSNDTSAGLLLLASMVGLERRGAAAGLFLAAGVAFKPFALAWLPALLVGGGRANTIGFAIGSAVLWGPAVALWGIGPIAASISAAQTLHDRSYYSIPAALESVTRRQLPAELFDRLRLALGAATAVLTAPFARAPSAVVVSGVLVYLVTLYTGYWATFAYLAAIAPVLCWHADRLLGPDAERIPWPGDPAGRLGAWLDARWPRVSSAA
jgi:hypothetical protein